MTQQEKSTMNKLVINATKTRERALRNMISNFGDINVALATWFKVNRDEYIGGTKQRRT